MSKFREYISETYTELVTKVSWPTWKELQSSALIVMVASVIIALLVAIMDKGFNFLLDLFYKTF